MEIDATVSARQAFESKQQVEVSILFLGHEISILPSHSLAMNDSIFNDPFFLTHLLPTG
jgi:hypothetical protein